MALNCPAVPGPEVGNQGLCPVCPGQGPALSLPAPGLRPPGLWNARFGASHSGACPSLQGPRLRPAALPPCAGLGSSYREVGHVGPGRLGPAGLAASAKPHDRRGLVHRHGRQARTGRCLPRRQPPSSRSARSTPDGRCACPTPSSPHTSWCPVTQLSSAWRWLHSLLAQSSGLHDRPLQTPVSSLTPSPVLLPEQPQIRVPTAPPWVQ